jgi:hypothetical protein
MKTLGLINHKDLVGRTILTSNFTQSSIIFITKDLVSITKHLATHLFFRFSGKLLVYCVSVVWQGHCLNYTSARA